MGKNYFTKEQQAQLRANPYIKKVSEKAITYTKEFRKEFAREYQTGKLPHVILREMGIDSKLLGRRRQDQIVRKMREGIRRPEGFEDTRKGNRGRSATKVLTEQERIARLEHQPAHEKIHYLRIRDKFKNL